MNTKRILTVFTVAALLAGPAMAQTSAETQRDISQQNRIEQGEQSGQLSSKEAGKLENQQAKIDKTEAKADANGTVSKREQRKINREQNRASKKIYKKKHNTTTGTTSGTVN